MYPLVRSLLFRFQPESAHHLTFSLLRFPPVSALLKTFGSGDPPQLHRRVAGLDFSNPIGLAAGLDKDALAYNELGALGFGFVEIGTVTPRPQPGNDKPRLFRLTKDEALINRMGFNNLGAEAAAARLRGKRRKGLIIGGNIGKNKVTPNEEAVKDYLACVHTLKDVVDYFVVNVSSPNTPNLRQLQDKAPLTALLKAVQDTSSKGPAPRPVFLKIAPDLTDSQLDDIIEIVRSTGIAGVIATNTTISREGLSYDKGDIEKIGAGGLSGKPLTARSTAVIRYLRSKGGKGLVIMGVGGIHSERDALEKLDAGADLIQLYTGFIYHGPGLITDIKKALLQRK
jgi:dihydroorotate dehydrogenase